MVTVTGADRGAAAQSPGRRAAVAARNALEEALLGLADIAASFDREGVRDRLLRAIQNAYVAIDNGPLALAHVDGLAQALSVVTEAIALIPHSGAEKGPAAGVIARLRTAETALREGHDAAARHQFAHRSELYAGALGTPLPEPRPFRASAGTPRLHAFPRASLAPTIDVGAPAPTVKAAQAPDMRPPRTLADLAAFKKDALSGKLRERAVAAAPEEEKPEPPPPLPLLYTPAAPEAEMLRCLGRSYLEDIAAARNLRKPNAIESWLDQRKFEQRLLDSVDAFAALGAVALPLLSLFHAEAKAPDPERAFAMAFVLGCVDGADTVSAALLTMKQSDPEEMPGWLEGFWLAPSPAVDAAMLDLATSGRPAWICLALDVLHARGTPASEVISALAERPEVEIRRRVARALGSQLPRREAIDRLVALAAAGEDGVFLEAAEALLVRGHGPALDLLREAASGGPSRAEGACVLLALAGHRGDLDRLLDATRAAPSAALVRALGRFGHVESLDALIGLCGHEDEDVSAASAEALERITGAGLYETVEEPWDLGLPPEAAHAGDMPVPTRKVSRVVRDPERWAAWVRGKSPRFEASVRTRAGGPFVASQIVAELRAAQTPPDRREEALRELRVATGVTTAFSPWDWVARQEERLDELESEVSKRVRPPGSWGIPIVRDEAAPAPPAAPARASVRPEPPSLAPPPPPPPPAAAGQVGGPVPVAGVEAPPPAAPVAPPVRRPDPLLQTMLALPDETLDGESGTQPPQRSPLRPVLPFQQVARPAEAAPPSPAAAQEALLAERIGGITVGQYAAICAAVSRSGAEAESLFALCGLTDPAARAGVDLAWQARLRQDAAMKALWSSRYASLLAERAKPPSVDALHRTGPLDLRHVRIPATPFTPQAAPDPGAQRAPAKSGADARGPTAGAATPRAAAPAAELTLDQYASMCAELAVFPERAEAVFAKHGLADVRRRAAVDAAWKARLSQYPSERAEWERRYWQFESSFRRSRR